VSSFRQFLLYNPLLNPIRLTAWNIMTKLLAERNLAIVAAGDEQEKSAFRELLKKVRLQIPMVLRDSEAYSIYSAVIHTAKIPGIIAEVGVYEGGSSWLISEMKGSREFHLFDTFEGLPPATGDDPKFKEGTFKSSLERVQKVLRNYPNLHFHKGLFPKTAVGLEDLRFSFVHIDVDLYQSTKDCLAWFYPRLNPGAMLISHDYQEAEGVKKAFTEFFADKPECLVELSGTQVCFIKTGTASGQARA